MNLSDMVHSGRRGTSDYLRRSPAPSDSASPVRDRGDRMMDASVATSLAARPYPRYRYSDKAPQPPPSPPVEEARCSLPSISSLFSSADGGSATPPEHDRPEPRSARSRTTSDPHGSQSRPYGLAGSAGSRVMLPPTPPLRPDTVFDGRQSPTERTRYSTYAGRESTPRQAGLPPRPPLLPPSTSRSFESTSSRSHGSPPGGRPSPEHAGAPDASYQRPLPQQFPPAVPAAGNSSSGANLWQHHHYISQSSQAAFPPSQDRYICQTCSKAFSRPSSLRIHSHSHTGEKPFKCPHQGCGKAFSVRSNMKRHERGCHSTSPRSSVSA
ncbi:MAG: hypothetical protein M1832_002496 [Thelocarpon impressellum]|nr:MAG: hypothetical protein M1832_002496 [Thelocarpon impressellum]